MLLKNDDIFLNYKFKNKTEALKTVGQILVDKGYVDKKYVKSMIQRDKVASVAIGNGLAIGHGMGEDLNLIKSPGMILIKLSEPLKWDDETVLFVAGLAIPGDQQIDILQGLAISFENFNEVKKLYKDVTSKEEILQFLEANESEDK